LFPPHFFTFMELIQLFFFISDLIIHLISPLMAVELKKILLDHFDLLGDIPKSFSSPRVKFAKSMLQFVV
jgi:hypothetical protein